MNDNRFPSAASEFKKSEGPRTASVILPTRNEPAIKDVILETSQVLGRLRLRYDILVVDKSSDETPQRAEEVGGTVIKQDSVGLGAALIIGMKAAMGEVVFTMDADQSHDPKHIPLFIEKLAGGYDVVVGSRKVEGGGVVGWSKYRKLISFGANWVGRHVAGVDVSDLTSGYRAYRRSVIEAIDLDAVKSEGYAFQLEILARVLGKGFKVGSVPIVFRERRVGKSKLTSGDMVGFLTTALKIRLGMLW